MRRRRLIPCIIALVVIPSFVRPAASLSDLPLSTLQNVVMVVCGQRQGSGALMDAARGIIVTAGHVALDTDGDSGGDGGCRVGFIVDATLRATSWDTAEVVAAEYDESRDIDFAVLRITSHLAGPARGPITGLATFEFAVPGDRMTVLGFPSESDGALASTEGTISGYAHGLLTGTARISPGSSGGPIVHDNLGVIGVASRITSFGPGEGAASEEQYQFGDVLTLIDWIDAAVGPEETHDAYLRHADAVRYHADALPLRADETSGCAYVAKLRGATAVYCLLSDARRLAFPNEAVFRSWYDDFSEVVLVRPEVLADYRLVGSVTYRPGSLVKITTDPKVYAVADSAGIIRHVPSEARAEALFGADWRTKVHDVPDASFVDYTVGAPLE